MKSKSGAMLAGLLALIGLGGAAAASSTQTREYNPAGGETTPSTRQYVPAGPGGTGGTSAYRSATVSTVAGSEDMTMETPDFTDSTSVVKKDCTNQYKALVAAGNRMDDAIAAYQVAKQHVTTITADEQYAVNHELAQAVVNKVAAEQAYYDCQGTGQTAGPPSSETSGVANWSYLERYL